MKGERETDRDSKGVVGEGGVGEGEWERGETETERDGERERERMERGGYRRGGEKGKKTEWVEREGIECCVCCVCCVML